ncbi:MAG: synthase protein [Actinomycetota bacterium]|jgi:F0F1-type ATP synthase assembly protein I|nr:synthase protein [Actinomycetota bacterium]
MAKDLSDDRSGAPPPGAGFREVDGWAVLSYIITGVLFYGAIGWLVDAWLGTRGFVAAGIVLGAAAGIWLVWLRYSKP